MTRNRPIRNFGRPLADVDHVLDLSLAGWLLPLALSDYVPSAQVRGKLLAKGATPLNVEGEIDRLVGNLHLWLKWIFLFEPPCNLLRRPFQLEPSHHLSSQPRVDRQLGRLGPSAPTQSSLFGPASSISLSATIPGHFSRHC